MGCVTHSLLTNHRIAIIMINVCEYGVPYTGIWLLRTMEVMFWVYAALSVFASAGLYLILWSTLYEHTSRLFGFNTEN